MVAGLLAGGQIAAFAQPQHHIEKFEIGLAIGDGEVLATNSADANAAERKNPGLHRSRADNFHNLAHVNPRIQIG